MRIGLDPTDPYGLVSCVAVLVVAALSSVLGIFLAAYLVYFGRRGHAPDHAARHVGLVRQRYCPGVSVRVSVVASATAFLVNAHGSCLPSAQSGV